MAIGPARPPNPINIPNSLDYCITKLIKCRANHVTKAMDDDFY